MRFTCDRGNLAFATASASRATVLKSSIPQLEGLLFEASDDGKVRITGYDLKTGIRCEIPGLIEEAGSTILTAKLVSEIIRKLPGDTVRITSDLNGKTEIESGDTKYQLASSAGGDYPRLPDYDGQSSFTIKAKKLKEMISQTVFAVSSSETRPVYTGELFEIENNTLTIVAVDGSRLALRRENIESGDEAFSFIIPSIAAMEVEKLLNNDDTNVEVVYCEKHILFKMIDTILISRRLEGEFLSYKTAIPDNSKYSFIVERNKLAEAVDRVSLIFIGELKNALRFKFADGKVSLVGMSTHGKAEADINIDGADEEIELGFNNKYISEALKAAPAEKLIWKVTTAVSPSVLVPENGDDSFVYMILPVRLPQNE